MAKREKVDSGSGDEVAPKITPVDRPPASPPVPAPTPVAVAPELSQRFSVDDMFLEMFPDSNERRRKTWMLAAAKAALKWPQGKTMSRDEFAKALDFAINQKINAPPSGQK